VFVKGTTTDGLGFAGAEGIAAWATALVRRAA
jgi:2C-methyl-D-erythritol 2,4-cyclodiphosphate synthase